MEERQKKVQELRNQIKSAVDNLTQQKAKNKELQSCSHEKETFSGIEIKLPREVPKDILSEALCDRKFVKLNQVKETIKSSLELQEDWVTIGVLVHKSPVKKAKNGNNYIQFTLGDLEGEEVKFLLFGEAYESWWQEIQGCLLGVLNSTPLPVLENQPQSYKIEKAGKLLKLGQAAYFAACSGILDNKKCSGYVNLKYSRVCGKHSKPKFKNLRPELRKIEFVPKNPFIKTQFKKQQVPRPPMKAKPQEFNTLDRYLALRNKKSKELTPLVEIEVDSLKRKQTEVSLPTKKPKNDSIN